jgi:hypothetical protein
MDKEFAKLAKWACIADAILCIPYFILVIIAAASKGHFSFHLGLMFVTVGYSGLSIVITIALMSLLEKVMNTKKYNPILWFIVISSVFPIGYEIIKLVGALSHVLNIFFIAVSIICQIAFTVFSFSARNLQSYLSKQWKRLCTINVVIGICCVLLITFPIGIILNVISSIWCAQIFSRASQ